jgi:predicted dehydrogenase
VPSLAIHCCNKFHIPKHLDSPQDVIKDQNVELVFILTSDEYHESLGVEALKTGKKVFMEKPLSLSQPSAERIVEAERAAGGNAVFVGYMRRYAPSFTEVFLKELESIPRIIHARVRDIIGPNSHFIEESGTYPIKVEDVHPSLISDRTARASELLSEIFGDGKEVSKEEAAYCRFLCSLASHDLSLMREAIGFPEAVQAVSSDGTNFHTAMFRFRNRTGKQEPYTVLYESGIDNVPRFDAHLAVYGVDKSIQIDYDTPFVKGLPIKVVVEEKGSRGERVRREILGSFEDAYTTQLKEVYDWFIERKATKTSATDAVLDAKLVRLMMETLRRQQSEP